MHGTAITGATRTREPPMPREPTNLTHVIGCDIHAHKHAIAIIPRSWFADTRWAKAKVLTIANNAHDYAVLDQALLDAGALPANTIAAIDRTGTHYSAALAHHLTQLDIPCYYLESQQIAALRTLHKSEKTDPNDARHFAQLAHQLHTAGHLQQNVIDPDLEERAAHLRALLATRAQLVKSTTQLTNRLRQLCIRCWPEAEATAWLTWSGVAGRCPTPAHLTDAPDLTVRIRARLGATLPSVGDTSPHIADAIAITAQHRDVLLTLNASVTDRVKQALTTHPYNRVIQSFPGIGNLTAAAIIAQLVDVAAIPTPKKCRTILGFGLTKSQSGSSETNRARKSTPPTKNLLFFVIINALGRKTPPYYALYYRKHRAQGKHHFYAAFAAAGKLCEHLWYALTTNTEYQPPEPAKCETTPVTPATPETQEEPPCDPNERPST